MYRNTTSTNVAGRLTVANRWRLHVTCSGPASPVLPMRWRTPTTRRSSTRRGRASSRTISTRGSSESSWGRKTRGPSRPSPSRPTVASSPWQRWASPTRRRTARPSSSTTFRRVFSCYRAILCIVRLSVCLSVRHTPLFRLNG